MLDRMREDQMLLLRYHRSCYAAIYPEHIRERVAGEDAGAEQQGSPFQRAFCHLKAEVEKEIIGQADAAIAVKMSSHYVSLLKTEGVLAPGYRTSNLKVRLQQCFGDRIWFA